MLFLGRCDRGGRSGQDAGSGIKARPKAKPRAELPAQNKGIASRQEQGHAEQARTVVLILMKGGF